MYKYRQCTTNKLWIFKVVCMYLLSVFYLLQPKQLVFRNESDIPNLSTPVLGIHLTNVGG